MLDRLVFHKGSCDKKDPNFWCPDDSKKEFDFVVVGRRRKNIKHIKKLAIENPDIKIATVGWGGKWLNGKWEKINFFKLKNIIEFGRLNDHKEVRDVLRRSKLAIAATMSGGEGFPMQTQMEYSLTGLFFGHDKNMLKDNYYVNDNTGTELSIDLLDNWKILGKRAREYSINNFSSDISADCLMKIIKEKL